jgi:hypothetical protein
MRVADPKGKWYRNTGSFVFVDPETGTRFEAGELVKATPSNWLKTQPVLREEADPTGETKAKK